MPRIVGLSPDLYLFRLADRLAQIGAAIYCGFPPLVCLMYGKVAQAWPTSRVTERFRGENNQNVAAGLSVGLSDRRVVQISFEQSRVVEQSEASLEAPINQGETEMLNDNRTGFWRSLTAAPGLAATA